MHPAAEDEAAALQVGPDGLLKAELERVRERARAKAGYVPKGQAKRLEALMDAGTPLVGISTCGTGAGREGTGPQILVCEQRLMDHLRRIL